MAFVLIKTETYSADTIFSLSLWSQDILVLATWIFNKSLLNDEYSDCLDLVIFVIFDTIFHPFQPIQSLFNKPLSFYDEAPKRCYIYFFLERRMNQLT